VPKKIKMLQYSLGKRKKNIDENASCFYVATCKYFHEKENPKRIKTFEKYLNRVRVICSGDDRLSTTENLLTLSKNVYFNKALIKLILNGVLLSFEHKKALINMVHDIFKVVDRGDVQHNAKYFDKNINFTEIVSLLLENYNIEDMNFFSGNLLRIFVKHEELLKKVLNFTFLDKLIKLVEDPRFEISSEAFETFQNVLIHKKEGEKKEVFQFVKNNWQKFFDFYYSLLNYDNYLSQRSCLKTLYEFLDDKFNEELMIKYISIVDNLKIIINFLSTSTQGIQYEAFMLLELLIKNLNKCPNPDIKHLILKNKQGLIKFVKELNVEAEEEYKLNREMMLSQLENLH